MIFASKQKSKTGISDEKVSVVATCDKSGNKDFKVATRQEGASARKI
jgi:hypothetical protein